MLKFLAPENWELGIKKLNIRVRMVSSWSVLIAGISYSSILNVFTRHYFGCHEMYKSTYHDFIKQNQNYPSCILEKYLQHFFKKFLIMQTFLRSLYFKHFFVTTYLFSSQKNFLRSNNHFTGKENKHDKFKKADELRIATFRCDNLMLNLNLRSIQW